MGVAEKLNGMRGLDMARAEDAIVKRTREVSLLAVWSFPSGMEPTEWGQPFQQWR
jgi:ribulose 1,5-bisphosphate synthetase/thiazole synthase